MPREYPRLVYKSASQHIGVNTEAEYAEALKLGYYNSVPEAATKKHAEGSEPVAPKPPEAIKGVKVYKGDQTQEVPDQATADALITGDGWFKTADEARAAAKKK